MLEIRKMLYKLGEMSIDTLLRRIDITPIEKALDDIAQATMKKPVPLKKLNHGRISSGREI